MCSRLVYGNVSEVAALAVHGSTGGASGAAAACAHDDSPTRMMHECQQK